jgi:DNA topoisomerase-1
MRGKYGPYVTDGKINATVPKGTDPNAVTLEQALALIAERAAKGPSPKQKKKAEKAAAKAKTKAAAKPKPAAKAKAKPKAKAAAKKKPAKVAAE